MIFSVNKIFLIRLLSLFSKGRGVCFPECNGLKLSCVEKVSWLVKDNMSANDSYTQWASSSFMLEISKEPISTNIIFVSKFFLYASFVATQIRENFYYINLS